LIPVERAQEIVLANLPDRRTEEVLLENGLGRVLAQEIFADANVPPFRRSAMDGFALRAADIRHIPARLTLVGEVRAGSSPTRPVGPGEAMAIFTGAPVPEGADAVQMVEQTERSEEGRTVTILKPLKPGENITPAGHEAAAGERILESGRVIGAAELAVLATFGCSRVRVWSRPSVALLGTGDELVDVSQIPGPGQIRNSNRFSLTGQLANLGIRAEYLGTARDDEGHLRELISDGLNRDVLILTGGVSMGDYDLVKGVLGKQGLTIHFTRVAMKPGKPTVFASRTGGLIFGLPGNPVSTFVSFENFVRPALGRLCGMLRPELPRVRGRLLREMRQSPGRTAFLPAWVSMVHGAWEIDPLRWRGSGDIIGFSRCNATVIFPGDRDYMARDESVEAMLLPDYFNRHRED
jgi:molybdopterin molybdotransferase